MTLIERLAEKLPGPWDAIVGIPRGGLIVASLLGYALDVPRIESVYVEYRRDDAGLAIPTGACARERFFPERLLLVEDGTDTGRLQEFARLFLERRGARAEIVTTAVWVKRSSSYRPDVWLEEVDILPSARDLFGGVS